MKGVGVMVGVGSAVGVSVGAAVGVGGATVGSMVEVGRAVGLAAAVGGSVGMVLLIHSASCAKSAVRRSYRAAAAAPRPDRQPDTAARRARAGNPARRGIRPAGGRWA